MDTAQTITGRTITLPRVCYAITLWQPWATWIALGWKRIETRTHDHFAWLADRRIAIHAGKKWDESYRELAGPFLSAANLDATPELAKARGAILALAVIEECCWLGAGDSAAALCPCGPERFGLRIGDMSVFAEPIPAKGRQGAWRWRPGPEPEPGKTLFER